MKTRWEVGDEDVFEVEGVRVHVRRARFGWTVWLVDRDDKHLAPISTGNYDGASIGQVLDRVVREIRIVKRRGKKR